MNCENLPVCCKSCIFKYKVYCTHDEHEITPNNESCKHYVYVENAKSN